MNGRELYEALYTGEEFDRLPLPGVGPWVETLERWHREGLPEGQEPNQVLGLISDDTAGLPLNLNMVPQFPLEVLSEGPEYVTLRDEYGITKRMRRVDYDRSGGYMGNAGATSSMSHWVDFPVKDLRSWKTLYEERFRPDLTDRLPADWAQQKAEVIRRAETRWVMYFCFPLGGLFGGLRQLLGLEGLVFAMADDPGLVRTMVDDLTRFWVEVFGQVLTDGVRLDAMWFFEDMAATKAPLLSPAMFREFFAPGYRKVCGALRELGVRQFIVDSDGNAEPLIPELAACGVTGIQPCEVQSGMDAERLRLAYPDFALQGGIDKRALARGPEAVAEELRRRYTTAWTRGRYLPYPDHGLPPDVPWANVEYFAERVKQLCAGPPR